MLREYQMAEGRIVPGNGGPHPIQVFINPSDEEKQYLIHELQIDEHTLNSALDPDELSRLEFEPNHFALIFKLPRNYSAKDQLVFRVASMGAFLFKERLVLVLSEDTLLFDGKPFTRVLSPLDLLLKLLNRSIAHFLGHLKIINMLVDELEQKISTSMENRYLLNLFSLEKSLVYYVSAINSNVVVMEKLRQNNSKIGLSAEQLDLLEDLIVENNQCLKQAEIYSNILASLMDARVSIVNNNLNILMKTLSIIAIAIMTFTLVVSAFSMNVALPIQHHPFAFWFIMTLASTSVLLVILLWRHLETQRTKIPGKKKPAP